MVFAISGDYNEDVKRLEDFAQSSVSAYQYYDHVVTIQSIFNHLIRGTDRADKYPQRIGLARKIHDELFPIAFFARLYFARASNVFIESKIGNQNYDAIVDDRRDPHLAGPIKFLEVTTLQDKKDSDLLGKLAKNRTVSIVGDAKQSDFERKMLLLRKILQQKAQKDYPPGTSLLIYTDEHRFRTWSFGVAKNEPDWQGSIIKIANEYLPALSLFSGVFIFSRENIYYPPDAPLSTSD